MSHTYAYSRPMVTVDTVVFGVFDCLKVLIIQRKDDPCKDQWALPGGYLETNDVDGGEDLEAGARRELREETSVETKVPFVQIISFGKPKRDPRGRVITVPFFTVIDGLSPTFKPPKAADDAKKVDWRNVESIVRFGAEPLAFDHNEIVMEALIRLKGHYDFRQWTGDDEDFRERLSGLA